MLKARSGDLLVFGLSAENLKRLQDGSPIAFDLKDLGATGRVFIFYGETEADMRELLAKNGMLPADAAPEGRA
jgi:hypothetical protein